MFYALGLSRAREGVKPYCAAVAAKELCCALYLKLGTFRYFSRSPIPTSMKLLFLKADLCYCCTLLSFVRHAQTRPPLHFMDGNLRTFGRSS